jgi:hypothetical protein
MLSSHGEAPTNDHLLHWATVRMQQWLGTCWYLSTMRMTQWLGTCLLWGWQSHLVPVCTCLLWGCGSRLVPVYCEDDTVAWYLSVPVYCKDGTVAWYLSVPVYCEDDTVAWYLSVPVYPPTQQLIMLLKLTKMSQPKLWFMWDKDTLYPMKHHTSQCMSKQRHSYTQARWRWVVMFIPTTLPLG